MCFSLFASVTAGTALVATGGVTTALARRRAEVPLAVVPLLFGVQQLVEGVVWWSLDHGDTVLNTRSTFAYSLFSLVLWPVLVPVALLCLESVPWRRRAMAAFLAVGVVVGLEGLALVLRGPSTSRVTGRSIQYAMPGAWFVALYLLATCGAVLVSGRRMLRWMGAAALGLGLLTLRLYTTDFVSVWCFFSAVLTLLVLVYLRSLHVPRRPLPG